MTPVEDISEGTSRMEGQGVFLAEQPSAAVAGRSSTPGGWQSGSESETRDGGAGLSMGVVGGGDGVEEAHMSEGGDASIGAVRAALGKEALGGEESRAGDPCVVLIKNPTVSLQGWETRPSMAHLRSAELPGAEGRAAAPHEALGDPLWGPQPSSGWESARQSQVGTSKNQRDEGRERLAGMQGVPQQRNDWEMLGTREARPVLAAAHLPTSLSWTLGMQNNRHVASPLSWLCISPIAEKTLWWQLVAALSVRIGMLLRSGLYLLVMQEHAETQSYTQ